MTRETEEKKVVIQPNTTTLALERTRLAYERTLMAWVRTAASLISFGFTIYKFFQYMQENQQGAQVERLISPHGYAILMISTGLVALLLATVQHRRSMQRLKVELPGTSMSLAGLVSTLILTLGILALFATIFQQ